MLINNPTHGLLQDSMAEVLRALDRMTPGRTGRTIAAACPSFSVSSVNIALRRLEEIGVVRSEAVPPAKQYFLNHSHVMTAPLIQLVTSSAEMLNWLRARVGGIPDLLSVTLFGSVARGDDSLASDVDLLLVFENQPGPDIPDLLQQLKQAHAARYGNDLGTVLLKLSDLEASLNEVSVFVSTVAHEGKDFWGERLIDLIERSNNETQSSTSY